MSTGPILETRLPTTDAEQRPPQFADERTDDATRRARHPRRARRRALRQARRERAAEQIRLEHTAQQARDEHELVVQRALFAAGLTQLR
ncbi:hypothetical protein ACT3SP_16850 [Brachybacterium sp. AOP43-C2-M15]|uniref:hypothetical protein n=1 Tax=Brachybacterium sp. AOP43-C2-M15 TaxID=3457661 RepID=UPI004034C75E